MLGDDGSYQLDLVKDCHFSAKSSFKTKMGEILFIAYHPHRKSCLSIKTDTF